MICIWKKSSVNIINSHLDKLKNIYKIIITSGLGFIGSSLAFYLNKKLDKSQLYNIDIFIKASSNPLILIESNLSVVNSVKKKYFQKYLFSPSRSKN